MLDLHRDHVTVHWPPSSKKDSVAEYIWNLDAALHSTEENTSCRVIALDVSVPEDCSLQATVAALVFAGGGGVQVDRVTSAAGRHTPPEAERFALQIGVLKAIADRAQSLVLFLDSMPAIETLLDCSLRSGQIFSLDACQFICPWFAQSPGYTITAWHVPSCFEWKIQHATHDVATLLRIGAGTRPHCSLDFLCNASNEAARRDWNLAQALSEHVI